MTELMMDEIYRRGMRVVATELLGTQKYNILIIPTEYVSVGYSIL